MSKLLLIKYEYLDTILYHFLGFFPVYFPGSHLFFPLYGPYNDVHRSDMTGKICHHEYWKS